MASFYLKRSTVKKLLVFITIFIIITTIVIVRKTMNAHPKRQYRMEMEKVNVWQPNRTRWLIQEKPKAKIEKLGSSLNNPDFGMGVEEKKPRRSSNKMLKIFHLDLKGAPPKMKYLSNVLPIIRQAGANAILIEYEDMFPFTRSLRNVSARNCYTREEVKNLIDEAETLKMEVIPLVQTFGHLEFVLKLEEFQHYRELDAFPQELCPSKKESIELIKEMIRQVMELHPHSKYIHIGCDEVYHLGACPRCSGMNPRTIFTKHVRRIGHWVRDNYPGVIPLIWDDMLRHWSAADLQDSDLGSVVEPVVWVYIEDLFRLVPHYVWYMYRRVFPRLWAASAFKGAFGETEIVPDISRHFENHLSWIRFMKNKQQGFDITPDLFGGIFLTGWSRYDHFAVLAELLPVGIPSLILNIILIDHNFNDAKRDDFNVAADPYVFDKWLKILQCPSDLPATNLQNIKSNQWLLGSCSFPGSNLYTSLPEYYDLRTRLNIIIGKAENNGWVSDYNVKHNYTNPMRVIDLFPEEGFAGQHLQKDILAYKKLITVILTQYYDNATVVEWVEQKIVPLEVKIEKLINDFQGLIRRKTWPRRPLRSNG